MADKIGLFGGTFNPPHNGHIEIIKSSLKYFNFSKLIVMPAFIPPHKTVDSGWDAQTRFFMTGISVFYFFPDELDNFFNSRKNLKWRRFKEFYERNFLQLHNPRVILSDYEIKKGGISYTIETVEFLRSLYPDSEISIIIGTDEAMILDKWMDYKKLFDIAKFIVAKRPNFDEKEVRKKFPELIFFPSKKANVSSTEIREKIKKGEDISNYVPSVIKLFLDYLIS